MGILAGAAGLYLASDLLLNHFLAPRVQKAFNAAYPAGSLLMGKLHYHFRENCLACDSLILKTRDSSLRCSIARCCLRGARWTKVLLGPRRGLAILAGARWEARNITLTFGVSGYELRCGRLRASVPDSEVEFEAIDLHPAAGDQAFFAASPFKRTRFHLIVPRGKVAEVAWPELLRGKGYTAGSVELEGLSLDVLMNQDKPLNPHPRGPFTPGEALGRIQKPFTVDRIDLRDGRLNLGEIRAWGAEPGVLTFGKVRVAARGISNQAGRGITAVARAEGEFMDAARLSVSMEMPLTAPELSLQYSGSMGPLDLRAINPFLEIAGHTRINSGRFQEGMFSIAVVDGHAKGELRAVYQGLDITLLDKQSGIEGGPLDQLKTFLADHLVLRKNNSPEVSDSIIIGTVNYTRKPQEGFTHFIWFALRDGIFDVLGLNDYVKGPKNRRHN